MARLAGKRVVITRAAHQSHDFASLLQAEGAIPLFVPTVAILPPANPEALQRAASSASEYDWIVFTSTNGVDAFADSMSISPASVPARIAVIGSGTRQHAESRGFKVTLSPDKFVSEGLLEAFDAADFLGKRVLIPASAISRDILPAKLRIRGAQVDVVEAYRNGIPREAATRAAEVFREPFPDWVTFASPSAADHLMQLADPAVVGACRIASIGSVTSVALRKHGLAVHVEANPHTIPALLDAMASFNQET